MVVKKKNIVYILSRSADYTIQGFIYQFNKTLLEIFNDEEDVIISDIPGFL